ncbi:hypothetical protein JX265_012996 [Neoarthrinium moseri]|uniref:Uncharacterized protein n=1 Tax=Neoarthrinium moseri TaxID=1658444 RepID=A0A9P9W969_9PEZI|nr:hypothetical protein JX265_012996 [Neoarthrinium moseri]
MFFESQTVTPGLKAGKGLTSSSKPHAKLDIIDIRQAAVELNLKEEIHRLLRPQEGPRTMPTLLLYDERGLQIFEQIELTYLEEYYLTNSEIQVLRRSAHAIAKAIPSGSMVVELGSGNLRKVQILLEALEEAHKEIDYYALDLSKEELERTLAQVPSFRWVKCHGLLGTYDDGREWLKQPSISARPKCVMSLGSSIDREGLTHQFILNGLVQANKVLGMEAFNLDDWQVIGEYVYDVEGGRHQAFYAPIRDVTVLGNSIKAHERVQVEQSLKYSEEGMNRLWTHAGVVETTRWMTEGDEYGLHLLTKPTTMPFSLNPDQYAATALPSLDDWKHLWATWDTVTRCMLPSDELLDKPIKLRNACIFYLGHIPTFLDIQLSKTTKTPPTDPTSYYGIFERGIDPDVDNPEQCHAHSEVPNEWPPTTEILEYQKAVRARLTKLYSDGPEKIPRDVARGIWVAFEHEVMHIETLLYMMLQSDKTLPPPGIPYPNFEALAREAAQKRTANEWFNIPEQQIAVGLDDPEDDKEAQGHFGWDNEKPCRRVTIPAFQAKARPITNEEYARYMYDAKVAKAPTSWTQEPLKENDGVNGNGHINGQSNGHNEASNLVPLSFLEGKAVRTVYGLVPLEHALDWPVYASYNELAGCAAWMGGRIPTFEEARSIYSYVDYMKKEQAERKLGKTVPAVNGHLVNDGVEETPPSKGQSEASGASSGNDDLFMDLTTANVGFTHWHPTAVTAHGNRLAGQAEMGGVWEWTSSPLTRHEGFEPMALYPAYTADFFDGKHNVVLGGSWATHPRVAGRKSL